MSEISRKFSRPAPDDASYDPEPITALPVPASAEA